MEINKSPKISKKFSCILCDYNTSKSSEYSKHVSTSKHKKNEYGNNLEIEEISKISSKFKCNKSNKLYNTNSGLWKHNKICIVNNIEHEKDNPMNDNTELVKFLIQESCDLKNIILEFIKNNASGINHNNNNNTHTNSHNKTFNLQFFLNEQCKDAMNMSEFINQIHLKLSDLENVGKVGYIEGISNIIIKKLNDTDMYKRPLHCSDAKRETLYIKEEDKWEKESPENTNMKKMIKKVDNKSIGLISEWKHQHPNHRESTCRDNDTYLKILVESMSGDEEHMGKVIKKISKEVVIDK